MSDSSLKIGLRNIDECYYSAKSREIIVKIYPDYTTLPDAKKYVAVFSGSVSDGRKIIISGTARPLRWGELTPQIIGYDLRIGNVELGDYELVDGLNGNTIGSCKAK